MEFVFTMTSQFCHISGSSTTRMITHQKPVLDIQEDLSIQPMLFLTEGEARQGEGGLRTHNCFKKTDLRKPLVTVVTVVYNGEQYLEETILSVIDQTYDNIEYIIIDGKSTDKTVEIIKKYESKIDYWVSEKDSGLYDAMNKGLFLATGKWINFMNCGDTFQNIETVDKVFVNDHSAGVIYGDVMFSFDGTNAVYVKAKELDNFWKGMQFVHQASFVLTALMRKYPFDTSFKLIADYKSLYQIYLSRVAFTYIDMPICKFQAGGLSDNNPKSISECYKMICNIHNKFYVKLYYTCRYIECFFKYNMALLIGQSSYSYLRFVKSKFVRLLSR